MKILLGLILSISLFGFDFDTVKYQNIINEKHKKIKFEIFQENEYFFKKKLSDKSFEAFKNRYYHLKSEKISFDNIDSKDTLRLYTQYLLNINVIKNEVAKEYILFLNYDLMEETKKYYDELDSGYDYYLKTGERLPLDKVEKSKIFCPFVNYDFSNIIDTPFKYYNFPKISQKKIENAKNKWFEKFLNKKLMCNESIMKRYYIEFMTINSLKKLEYLQNHMKEMQ